MIKHMTKLTGWTASLLALAATAAADVKINENLSLSGYAVGAYTVKDPSNASNTSTTFDSGNTNFDAVKVALIGKYDDFSGKVSLFYVPESTSGGSEAGLLDAFVTYTAGSVAVTGGKFLSYLGYEAWDSISMTTITYSNSWNPIPGYHTGAKVDYTGKGFALGAAVVDSLYMTPKVFFGGDGNFSNGLGYEAMATYTGIDKLTVFAGVGFEDPEVGSAQSVYDLWASYAVSAKLTVAGEYSYSDNAFASTTTNDYWAAFATYAFTNKVSVTGRVSGVISDEAGTQLTVSPTYTFNSNCAVRAEVTYSDSAQSAVQATSSLFYGIQGIFKF